MNKKPVLILVLFTVLCILPLFAGASAEEVDSGSIKTFVFPSSLKQIEEAAFEGTAVETVVFQEGFISIGSNAFKNAIYLRNVYIPDTTISIADSAFLETTDLTIHGLDSSYAKEWAYKQKIPFVVDNIWIEILPPVKTQKTRPDPIKWYITILVLIVIIELFSFYDVEVRSRRQQDRPEMNPIEYCFP